MDDAARLALYIQAEEDILLYGQSTAVPGRNFQSADLSAVQSMIERLRIRVNAATYGPVRLAKGNQ
jgi:hypothetical protein